jgi:hypothetical protein
MHDQADTPHGGYVDRVLKSCATFLRRWTPATARLRELTVSHPALVIELTRDGSRTRDGRPGNLILACLEPTWISGPVRWAPAHLAVTHDPDRDEFHVRDAAAGLEVRCGGIEVAENVKHRAAPR